MELTSELTELQHQILTPFVDETIETLASMAGLNAHAGEGFPDDVEKFRFKGYAVVAETSGVIEGVILMHHYVETALGVGNRVLTNLLGEESNAMEMNDEVGEALAEFGNTAIGLAMDKLAKTDLGIKFKPPYFISNTTAMDDIIKDVKEIISIPIHVDEVGRFYFNYLLHNPTE